MFVPGCGGAEGEGNTVRQAPHGAQSPEPVQDSIPRPRDHDRGLNQESDTQLTEPSGRPRHGFLKWEI